MRQRTCMGVEKRREPHRWNDHGYANVLHQVSSQTGRGCNTSRCHPRGFHPHEDRVAQCRTEEEGVGQRRHQWRREVATVFEKVRQYTHLVVKVGNPKAKERVRTPSGGGMRQSFKAKEVSALRRRLPFLKHRAQ
ncbi:hypothetical protein H257_00776 [Aphanomyces astaci]|uniref:Uncharacterized protein n=1 Tax=Aphanomyces astaci TaxID=112090 RepID=W4HDX8_APHAT|nr:hypothetical protein H257_00776 [Aphanomyces astaci]ETV89524.1 hypothetical protein H257_00776 [Aphanomyces astaci]|eukprot:XP_009821924.1 hypothetical protein H257_00776 [Aphanomyces astaci]